MKLATTSADYRDSQESLHRASRSRVRKISKKRCEQAKTLNKLRLMVGTDEHSSQLEIIQHVMDYISHMRKELAGINDSYEKRADTQLVSRLAVQLSAALKNL